MSNARELALIEKWADIATTPSLPSLSPTSPKATKFCCCPQRSRRYNLTTKPTKKSTLHARNIFIDNDFTNIDDVAHANNDNNNSNSINSKRSSTSNNDCDNDYDDIVEIAGSNISSSNSNSNGSSKYDGSSTVKLMNERNYSVVQQWRQENNSLNSIKQQTTPVAPEAPIRKYQFLNNTYSSSGNEHIAANALEQSQQQQSQQQQPTQRLSNSEQQQLSSNKENNNCLSENKSNTQATATGSDDTTNADSNKNNIRCNYCKLPEPQMNNNNSSGSSGDNNDNSKIDTTQHKIMTITTATTTATAAAAATTNIATNLKLNECGLTATKATTPPPISAAEVIATLPTLAATTQTPAPAERPTTPSRLKTVIKTTMVKRSPSNESTTITTTTAATATTTTASSPSSLLFSPTHMLLPTNSCQSNGNNNKLDECIEPRRSVRERIAAYAAGNEQTIRKQHDNVNKLMKIQCNNNKKNQTTTTAAAAAATTSNMTSDVKSAISNLQQQQQPKKQHHNQTLINGNSNKCTTTAIAAVPQAAMQQQQQQVTKAVAVASKSIKNLDVLPCHESGLNVDVSSDVATTTTTMATAAMPTAATGSTNVFNTGCATVPRIRQSRSTALALAAKCDLADNIHGSNTTAATAYDDDDDTTMTVDKKFLSCANNAHKPLNGDKDTAATTLDATCSTGRELAALDNLDLAHSLDLIDDDGEDPYFALQEYLERVKHEINEVFEFRKAQRMQQQQLEQQQQQQEAAISETTPTAVGTTNNNEATTLASVDELSRSTESDSGFDSATGERVAVRQPALAKANDEVTTANNNTTSSTKLRALPPPPLKPEAEEDTLKRQTDDVNIWANKFLRDLDNLMSSDNRLVNHGTSSANSSPTSRIAPMLLSAAAKAAIQSRYGKAAAAAHTNAYATAIEQQQQYNQQTANGLVLKPEKHATIPLQSFNLDCGRSTAAGDAASPTAATATKSNVAYMRTLSAPGPPLSPLHCIVVNGKNQRNSLAADTALEPPTPPQRQYAAHNLTNFQQKSASTILKIEEAAAGAQHAGMTTDELKSRRQRQLEQDMETIHNALLLTHLEEVGNGSGNCNGSVSSNKNRLVAMLKRERINHATTSPKMSLLNAETRVSITPPPATASIRLTPTKMLAGNSMSAASATATATTSTTTTTTTTTTSTPSYLLNSSDVTKKGSTSTIWTSEESILRSVGAVDEDNNSTSSSACEEATGVLSSGKSGISLDSSGLDNDNNESGIGTATPPKDMSYCWKSLHSSGNNNNDNESVSSLDALRKMKFQKSSSVASSDDPDLLEVLSLCDGSGGDGDGVGIGVGGGDADDGAAESHDDMLLDGDEQRQLRQRHQLKLRLARQQRRQCCRRQQHHDNDDSSNIAAIDDLDNEDERDLLHDDDDECHDEFELLRYCDCDCTDGDASSASGSGTNQTTAADADNALPGGNRAGIAAAVVLRRKYSAALPILVPSAPGGRAQKCRSHSLDTSSLPSAYQQQQQLQLQHNLQQQQQHLHQPHQQQHHQHHHGLPPLTRKLNHLPPQRHNKERVQLSLALRQEPFQSLLSPTHFAELPSPSSASLHSGHESLGIQELTTKSNSAPLLLKQERKRDDFAAQNLTLRYSRSQSDRYLAEIEAVEACKWLRAAGFPQYAQMYEDHQFPIDLNNVAKDHTNLENDQLQSLYRRLCILNRCANMRLDQNHKPQTPQQKEDSDDENFALSENWTFQPHIRRWSRIGEMGLELPTGGKLNVEKTESSSKESSPDRFEDDSYNAACAGITLMIPSGSGGGGGGSAACSKGSDGADAAMHESADGAAVRLRRTGSERFKDGAKAFLRRVESIKSRRRKRQNRDGVVISGPQMLDLTQLSGQRSSVRKPDGVYSTPPSPSAVSPMHTFPKGPFFGNELKVPSHSENFLSPNRASPKRTPTTPRSMRTSPLHFFNSPMPHLKEGRSDDSSSYYSDSQESSSAVGGKLVLRKTPSKARRFLQRTGKVDDIGAHSDSECHQGRKLLIKDANSNTTEVKIKKLSRGGSLNLGKDPKKRDGFRTASFRSRSTTRKENKTEDTECSKRTPVVRWHSFQMEERPHMIFRKCFSQKLESRDAQDEGIPFAAMSAGQLQIIRKLALVTLTGHMERYCPTHRSGWNWELPKFIKKIKMPDYKDKKVFGVPLLLILQRSGQSLPVAVRSAIRWLQLNALDQIGIFRKSGGKSRIIKLREIIETVDTTAECMDVFDTQQAYDVADMLKQYFRELPESLLTTKMSETFVAIFQHLPPEVRLDAVQCAVLLLPDENREILYMLLEFLTIIAANSTQNQMTSNNLGVCLAQSIFHSSISTGTASVSASPRRRGKGSGMPDIKELAEAKASHECLSFMIDNYKQIFTAPKDKLSKCNFGYMEESKPVPLEALGEGMQFHNWRGYLFECTSATIKEGRGTRGWINITSLSDTNVDIAYKKVGDGHPLRLWRCITEVDGPPEEVLEYIIKQRASWDSNLVQSQTVKKLDDRTEIFQYALDGQMTTDFCVLRSWQVKLPRNASVIVETSIDHAKAKPMFGAVRGVVLASRYFIEPCGSGRSRVMHLARVDIKGKTPEWYNKCYGHICSHYLSKIRLAFKNITDGPESKV